MVLGKVQVDEGKEEKEKGRQGMDGWVREGGRVEKKKRKGRCGVVCVLRKGRAPWASRRKGCASGRVVVACAGAKCRCRPRCVWEGRKERSRSSLDRKRGRSSERASEESSPVQSSSGSGWIRGGIALAGGSMVPIPP